VKRTAVVSALVLLLLAAVAQAQFGRGFGVRARLATEQDFDGKFHYCRLAYRSNFRGGFGRGGAGGSWTTDFPNADINLMIRLSELTRTNVSKQPGGQPNPLVVDVNSDELFQCPLIILSAPGAAYFDSDDATHLREYLLKGGMLWADDFWGSYQWEQWVGQISKVFPPDEYPIVDVPLSHAMFHSQFEVDEIPQIPNIGFWLRSGHNTSEQGADSATPEVKGILDEKGRIMVMMTHNTDIADSWEREGEDVGYFYTFGPKGYAFAVNTVLYAMTH
jgi:hypothetical protein